MKTSIPFIAALFAFASCEKPTATEQAPETQPPAPVAVAPDVEAAPATVTPDPEAEARKAAGAAEAERKAAEAARAAILRLRSENIGNQYRSLTLGDKVFQKAEILAIDDLGVKVSHSGGVFVMSWRDIQPAAQDMLGYDAAAEVVARANYKRPVLPELVPVDKTPEYRKQLAAVESEIARGRKALDYLTAQRAALKKAYKKQDTDAANRHPDRKGGIKTSRHDRAKNEAKIVQQINAAKYKLIDLEREQATLTDLLK